MNLEQYHIDTILHEEYDTYIGEMADPIIKMAQEFYDEQRHCGFCKYDAMSATMDCVETHLPELDNSIDRDTLRDTVIDSLKFWDKP